MQDAEVSALRSLVLSRALKHRGGIIEMDLREQLAQQELVLVAEKASVLHLTKVVGSIPMDSTIYGVTPGLLPSERIGREEDKGFPWSKRRTKAPGP